MRWVIAGGGTGGHLFPGMAIAEAFLEREMGNEVLFIGTERGIESRVLTGRFPLRTIRVSPLKGTSLLGKVKALWAIPMAVREALTILKEFQPHLVMGVGGYASGPALLAASLLGIKRAIQEQNVVPGMTNRMLRWFSQRIFVSFEETKRYFPKEKTMVSGNPVRKEILRCPDPEKIEEKRKDHFTLLIFGGSAGAHKINEAMMETLDLLQEIKPSLKIFHQTGKDDYDSVIKGYQEKGFDAVVRPFFEDMALSYQMADLVICRSGASTVAELAICGKAGILIPYPYAAHNHQFINAKKLVDAGGAKMICNEELNGPILARAILHLYRHPEERIEMEKTMRSLGRPRAAQEIVDHCYGFLREEALNAKVQPSI
ncbi:MAG: undecaprenyldiphospho-muramoylpentapeptide beta-N-acetylglucosaminyltransferase [Deltaproteobacteria bacterium RBG_16_50_11]|nr:MAG: undecaprenyldiphospho-muramoylpentapeptide beta-N-acetylglucosaminyltransferase [Deltaproteobacteria bacterium RBG_16_50_11]